MKGTVRTGWLAAPAAILFAASLASAGTVSYPDGKVVKLAPKTEVQGPCTITADNASMRNATSTCRVPA